MAPLLIAAASVAAYANTAGNEFVAGDLQFIKNNEAIKSLSVLSTAFTRGYWWVGGDHGGGTYYRPLLVLLDALDHLLWGSAPLGYHVTNLALHAAASLLVLSLGRALLRSPGAALAGALLFAVMPIHAHAVSYISARSALLCACFYTASVLSALRARDALDGGGDGRGALAASVGLYVLGLLSLEAAATMPVALLAAVALRPGVRARARSLAPFAGALVAVTVGYFIVRRLALGTTISVKEAMVTVLAPAPALLTMAKTCVFYLTRMFVPHDVSYLPPFTPSLSAYDPSGLASLAAVLGLVALVVAGPRRMLVERALIGWVLVTLAPVSGVVPLDHPVKGQYAYLPSVGAALLVASLLRRALRMLRPRPARLALALSFAVALVASLVATVLENRRWASEEALFARVIELEPRMSDELLAEPVMKPTAARLSSVHLLVASSLSKQGQHEPARSHAVRAQKLARRRSVRLQARQLEAHSLMQQDAFDAALAAYLPLVDEDQKDTLAPSRVAFIYLQRGQTAEALPYLDKACARGSKSACVERERVAGPQGSREQPAP